MTSTSRNEVLEGKTVRLQSGRGKVYVTMNRLEGRLWEVFITHGKAGGNDAAMAEALSRLISTALQSGAGWQDVVKQLIGITDVPIWDDGRKILSLPDAVAQAIQTECAERDAEDTDSVRQQLNTIQRMRGHLTPHFLDVPCPECKWYTLVVLDGSTTCATCGYGECD